MKRVPVKTLIGIDGCPSGWVAVSRFGAFVGARLADLLDSLEADVAAIDMPIGLAEDGPRDCEAAARRLLGRPRAASVFPVPVRAALSARSHAEAGDLNAAASGKRLSAQAFNLLPKIREVDALLRGSIHWRKRVYETHPEVCFAAMNAGGPLADPKRSAAGHAHRAALIATHFGSRALPNARAAIRRRDAANDDIADAFACLFTAERIARGAHVRLPRSPAFDARGLPMRIVY